MVQCLGEAKANAFSVALSECPESPNLNKNNW